MRIDPQIGYRVGGGARFRILPGHCFDVGTCLAFRRGATELSPQGRGLVPQANRRFHRAANGHLPEAQPMLQDRSGIRPRGIRRRQETDYGRGQRSTRSVTGSTPWYQLLVAARLSVKMTMFSPLCPALRASADA